MPILDRFRLDDQVVVVTGASSGLGVAFAQAFAEAGADVVLGARRVDRLPETGRLVEQAGRRYAHLQTDVTVPEQCEALVAKAVETFGRVDVLVNNAGLGWAKPASRETPEEFLRVVDVNLNGAYWMAQAFGRAARDGGSIINISSVLGLHPGMLPQAAYAASKAGLIGLTRDLAAQWTGRKGIRVNALAPGYFPTEMTDEMDPGEAEMVKAMTPAGRLGDPMELASVAVFLASAAASYVTGITVPVDGGMTMP
ncbi:MAG: 3-oxoacyl-[acyl-carrier protein] reductase [Frankiales bacterium]|nr:3-oxoacyl-[acyl-carrier protein] reductase [Frankiales bacterium]